MNKELIKKLQEGECAVKFESTDSLEKLQKLIKLAFSNDPEIPRGGSKYYKKSSTKKADWTATYETNLPVHSLEEFFELSFPRVMLVNDDNDIKKSERRVVIAYKRDKYISWTNAETEEEAEEEIKTIYWDYAWEIDEVKSIFPFSLKPEQAQSIIDIACESWKSKLFDSWGMNIVMKDDISISEEEYRTMYAACNSDQRALFDKIFK